MVKNFDAKTRRRKEKQKKEMQRAYGMAGMSVKAAKLYYVSYSPQSHGSKKVYGKCLQCGKQTQIISDECD